MLRAGARHPDADGQQQQQQHHQEQQQQRAMPSPSAQCTPSASTSTQPDEQLDHRQLFATLAEYLQLEHKFQPRLCLPADSESGEVTIGARDGAAHVLRCLKMWFDLPADVLISAISLLDRFLSKMRVRPCHVPCITVACMNVAIEEHWRVHAHAHAGRRVSIEELVAVSQSACTAGDVARMSRVLADKLAAAGGVGAAVTPLHWLRVVRALAAAAASSLGLPASITTGEDLVTMLEIVACDARCANERPAAVALVLVYRDLEMQLVEWSRASEQGACDGSSSSNSGDSSGGGGESEGGSATAAAAAAAAPESAGRAYRLLEFLGQLQAQCRISEAALLGARERVRGVLARYEARAAAKHRQRLVWRLSERTLRLLRPTDRLTSLLPTIDEQHHQHQHQHQHYARDWPLYCDN